MSGRRGGGEEENVGEFPGKVSLCTMALRSSGSLLVMIFNYRTKMDSRGGDDRGKKSFCDFGGGSVRDPLKGKASR